MVVMGVTRSMGSGAPLRRRGVERDGFGVTTPGSAAADGPVAANGVAVTSLLALQEAESGLQQDREARQHGTAIVDELTDLQSALLGGDGPDLHRLAALMARPVRAADPALAGLMRAVRLRAGIELARRGWATPV